MYPILFSIGPIPVYSFSFFLILSWILFSFLFWRSLRQHAVDEDKIYHITFYATLIALVVSRTLFVIFHWELFADTWLKIIAIWVQPGISFYGGLIGALLTLGAMSKSVKVRLGIILDAFAMSFPAAAALACIGIFLDGTIVGTITTVPWAMRSLGQVGLRHPVSLYQLIAFIMVTVSVVWITRKNAQWKMPYGMVGVLFFLLLSIFLFAIEFTSVRTVYWISISANQWILIGIFAESLGAFYVRGGARERIRPIINKIYAKLSKRRS